MIPKFALLHKTKCLVFILLFIALGCKKKSEETPAPTLLIQSSTAGTDVIIGQAKTLDTVTINLTAAALEGIKSLSVFKVSGGVETVLPGYPKTTGFDSDKGHLWSFDYAVTETGGEVVLKFMVTDKRGKTASANYKILVTGINAPTVVIQSSTAGADQIIGYAKTLDNVTLNLSAAASEGLKSLSVFSVMGGVETVLPGYPKTTGFDSDKAHLWSFTYPVTETGGEVVLKFVVTDKKGVITSVNYKIVVSAIAPPTIVMQSNSVGSNQSAGTVGRGSVVTFVVSAKAQKGIKSIHVTKKVNGVETALAGYPKTSGFSTDSTYDWQVQYTANDPENQVILTFTVENKVGEIQFITYTLTLTDSSLPLSYSAKLLGAQNNAAGSFFSPKTGLVYPTSDSANFIVNGVDISFAQIGAPVFISLSQRGTYGLKKVVTINRTTQFREFDSSTMNQGIFDGLTNGQLQSLSLGSTNGTIQVTSGAFYGFSNEEGKRGVIHVTNLNTGSGTDGSVTIDVKFEK